MFCGTIEVLSERDLPPPPTYDANGNATSFAKPDDDFQSFQAVYDAWNRLVRVMDTEDLRIFEYSYHARGYRIEQRPIIKRWALSWPLTILTVTGKK